MDDSGNDDAEAVPQPVRSPRRLRRWAARLTRPRMKLPINSDIEIARTVAGVPVVILLRPSYLALAALGGSFGAAARYWLTLVAPSWDTLSTAAIIANVVGPLLLGALLQSLAHRTESPRTRAVRLVAAVGFLGAFTSYAQLALDTLLLITQGSPWFAAAYATVTLVAGAAAAWLGIVVISRAQRRRVGRESVSK